MTLRPSTLTAKIATLIGGSFGAQIINLAAYPIVLRLFSPDDFGLFNILYSYIEVLTILSTGKYEMAIPLAENDHEAKVTTRLALRINACATMILLSVITLMIICDVLPGRSKQLGAIALFIPPMVFLNGTIRTYSYLYNRYSRVRTVAATYLYNTATCAGMKIILGLMASLYAPLHHIGQPIATLMGQAAAHLTYRFRRHALPSSRADHNDDDTEADHRLSTVARKYANIPRYIMPKDFVSSFSYNLPLLWLSYYFDEGLLGIFALALTFTFRPINIINNAFEQVLYAQTSQQQRQSQSIAATILKPLLRINLIALPFFIIGFIWAEPIFTFVFGEKWIGCGYYVRCLLPYTFVLLSSSSISFLPNLFGRQRTDFIFSIVMLVCRIASLGIGIMQQDFKLAILLYCSSSCIVSAVLLTWYLSLIRGHNPIT